jgi:DNA-binding phage protein
LAPTPKINNANPKKTMEDLKAPASNSYRESLISSLKDLEYAGDYIGVMLELDEDGYNPNILRSALEKVAEARKQLDDYSLSAQHYHKKLDKILAQKGGEEILTLIEFLDTLGYRIAVVAKDEETSDDSD